MSYVILDLDNCIADDAWRVPHINWQKKDPLERYHEYHSLSAFDAVGNADLFAGHHHEVIVFTARPVLYSAVTQEWLRRNGVPVKHLIMRNLGDHRPSVELKRHMLHWLPELYDVPWGEIVAAYDDRPDVVAMYAKHNIPAHERSIHDVCAYTPPQPTNTITVKI
jgi:hypothetical protein